MPDILFEKLHTEWPTLQLSVALLHRRISKETVHHKLDTRLLASPLLTDMTYTVYSDVPGSQTPECSKSLAATGSCALGISPVSLRSRNESNGRASHTTLTTANAKNCTSLNLDTQSRSTVLDELSSQSKYNEGGFAYEMLSSKGQVFRESINCTNIYALDFGELDPIKFSTALKGAMPGSKTLPFGTCGGSQERAPAVDFSKSVIALESLSCTHLCAMNEFSPAIMKHKDSLRKLDLGSTFHA